jgi:mRNA interferase RelE/StbE
VKHKFVFTQRAERDIKKLDDITKKRIGKTLLRFIDNPLDYAESLTDSNLGTYRFRIGDYRVVFDIEDKDIVVLRVGHRRELYKRS